MNDEALRNIGFSKNEAKIYRALIELGPSMIGIICGKIKVHRRNVYDSLEMLKDKGLVSATIINNRIIYEAVDPHQLIKIIEERNEELIHSMNDLLSKRKSSQSIVHVYTGQAGRKIMFAEKLKQKGEQYVLGAHIPSPQSKRFVDIYHHHRVQKKINLKMLFSPNEKEAAYMFQKYKLLQVRILPRFNTSPIAINIYRNKTALLLGSASLEPITIIIDDKGLANDMTSYFKMLWSISKPLR